ncbi:hypothetical protein FRC06_006657, partial [Ceratobasidium sp. 370]
MLVQDSRERYSYDVVRTHFNYFYFEDYSERLADLGHVSEGPAIEDCRTAWAEHLAALNHALEDALSEGDLMLKQLRSIEAEHYRSFETTERRIRERCAQAAVGQQPPQSEDPRDNNNVAGEAPPSYAEAMGLDGHHMYRARDEGQDVAEAGTSQNPIQLSDGEESE